MLDFECEAADKDFIGFALRPEGLVVIGYFKTEKQLGKVLARRPSWANMFVWDRNGECVDGAY